MRGYCLWSYGELWFELTSACAFLAGGFAGATSRTVVSPLERLKIIQYVLFVHLSAFLVLIGILLDKCNREVRIHLITVFGIVSYVCGVRKGSEGSCEGMGSIV